MSTLEAVGGSFLSAPLTAMAKGTIEQEKAIKQQAKFNEKLAAVEAAQAREAVAFEEARFREQADRLASRARAVAGASGVGLEGSVVEVAGANAADIELEAQAIRFSGAVAEARAKADAALARFQTGVARRAALLGGLSAGMQHGGQVGASIFSFGAGGAAAGAASTGGSSTAAPNTGGNPPVSGPGVM